MSLIAKSQSLMLALKDHLQKELPSTYVFTTAQDSAGAQLLISQDSTPSAGEQVVAIRIKGQDTQFNDSIGNAQRVYTPMVIQVIEEASTISGVSLITLANRAWIDRELARSGVKQERWLNTHGTVPALTQFNTDGTVSSSTLAATTSPDLYWPLSGQ